MTDDDLKSLALDFRDQMVGIDLLRAVFQAGAASRDAEVARLKTVPMKYRRMEFNAQLQKENDQLAAEIERKMSAAEFIIRQNKELVAAIAVKNATILAMIDRWWPFVHGSVMPSHTARDMLHKANEALAATPAQSLAHLRNEVLEKAAGVAYEHGANLSAKAIRAMKEPE